MLGMSPIGRTCTLGTSVLKKVRVILRSSKCASKTGPPKMCIGDVFYMRGDPMREKGTHRTRAACLEAMARKTLPWPRPRILVAVAMRSWDAAVRRRKILPYASILKIDILSYFLTLV